MDTVYLLTMSHGVHKVYRAWDDCYRAFQDYIAREVADGMNVRWNGSCCAVLTDGEFRVQVNAMAEELR